MKKFLVFCFTLIDLQNAKLDGKCVSDCQHDHYVSGHYYQDSERCWCADPKQLKLPTKHTKTKSNANSQVSIPYKNAEDDVKLPWD